RACTGVRTGRSTHRSWRQRLLRCLAVADLLAPDLLGLGILIQLDDGRLGRRCGGGRGRGGEGSSTIEALLLGSVLLLLRKWRAVGGEDRLGLLFAGFRVRKA